MPNPSSTKPRSQVSPFVEVVSDLLGRGIAVRFRAYGWSMGSAIPNGSVVWVEPCSPRLLRTGEVYLFRTEGRLLLHRVVARTTKGEAPGFVTKGDALPCVDGPLPESSLLGRLQCVERPLWLPRALVLLHAWARLRLAVARVAPNALAS